MEEVTGAFDSGVVRTVSGSNSMSDEQKSVVAQLKDLINKRNTQPKDSSKLTEEDISLLEQIIQKVENMK